MNGTFQMNLNPDQTLVLEGLLELFSDSLKQEDPTFNCQNVLGLVGPRGNGKTTLLRAFVNEISRRYDQGNHSQPVVATRIIDAALVPADQGLSGECIHALYNIFSENGSASPTPSSAGGPSDRRPWDQPTGLETAKVVRQDLEKAYNHCFGAALRQEESHRELARDLAMSPEHYAAIIREGAELKKNIGKNFSDFADKLQLAVKSRQSPGIGNKGLNLPRFLVIIDDADLAEPAIIRTWAKSFITHFQKGPVFWLFAFDRPRLRTILSTGEGKNDEVNGRSLLTKMVPFHRQMDLDFWSRQEAESFRSFSAWKAFRSQRKKTSKPISSRCSGAPPSLKKLFKNSGVPDMLPLLPTSPRGLESLYDWIQNKLNSTADDRKGPNHAFSSSGSPKKTGEPQPLKDPEAEAEGSHDKGRQARISRELLLRKLADLNGDYDLALAIKMGKGPRIAGAFQWDDGFSMSEVAWSVLMQHVRKSDPLWEMPLPKRGINILGNQNGAAYFEALIDLSLKERSLHPLLLLNEIPFIKNWLGHCEISLKIAEPEVRRYFNKFKSKETAIVKSLPWQHWSDKKVNGYWVVKISPMIAWNQSFNGRLDIPTAMLEKLYLGKQFLENISHMQTGSGDQNQSHHLFPNNFRSLLLLVDGLISVPWKALNAVRPFWGPISYTRCAAAMTLTALAFHLCDPCSDLTEETLFLENETSVSKILDLEENAIAGHYDQLLVRLGAFKPKKPKDPVFKVACRELRQALKNMLASPMITSLMARS